MASGKKRPELFEPEDPRHRQLMDVAIRWYITGFDATNRPEDADGVREHGWTLEEKLKVTEIRESPVELRKVLLAWSRHDRTKPLARQNPSNRDHINVLLKNPFFRAARQSKAK